MIAGFLKDLRLAARVLGRNPGFTAAAAFVLALGLGANTAIFNLLHAVLIRPLPGIEQPGRLVLIGRTLGGRGFDPLSYPNYIDYQARIQVFEGVAAPGFSGADLRRPPLEIWLPIGSPAQIRPEPAVVAERGWNWLSAVGRLRPGVKLEQARANLSSIAGRLAQEYPVANRDEGVFAVPYHGLGGGDARRDTGRMLVVVLVATVGLYAVIAYRVFTRRFEIGMRMALGAAPREILKSAVLDGMRLASAGLAAGILLALAGPRLLASFLHGVTPADPVTYAGVSSLLLGTTFVASYLPAWRAAKVDPTAVLRYE